MHSSRDSRTGQAELRAPPRTGGMPSRWSALLDVDGPGGHRTSLPFRPPRVLVGRKRNNDLTLPDQNVSSSHCEFVIEGGWFVVRDLASINGTYVNDKRISEARLRDGDVVRLGETKITVAMQGSLRGEVPWTEAWLARWPLFVVAALLLGAGGLYVVHRQQLRAEQALLRAEYASEVRAQLQGDACAVASHAATEMAELDSHIAGRPVPLAAPGQKLPPAAHQAAVELFDLYRRKADSAAHSLDEVSAELQKERDGLERASRLAARLTAAQDRKVAFFVQSQLAERIRTGEALHKGLTTLSQETHLFSQLVEAVSIRGEVSRTTELTAFRFATQGAPDQVASCKADVARSTAGAQGAINGLSEE